MRVAVAIVMCLALGSLGACGRALTRYEYSRICMGVRANVVLYATDHGSAERAATGAFTELARLDAMMSDYRASSEVSTLSRRAGAGPIVISPELHDVFLTAQKVSQAAEGAFDVTIGPASQLWRDCRRRGTPPTPEEIGRVVSLISWRRLELSPPGHTPTVASLSGEGMSIDLGGIAKGYAAQRARDALRDAGFARCLVSLAGDVAVGDPPPGTPGWRIEIRGERSGESAPPLGVLVLRGCVVSTSGDAEQAIELGGRRYSHVLDPRTGVGTQAGVLCTVIAERGDVADALATSGCVLDPPGLEALIRAFPDAAAIIRSPGHAVQSLGAMRKVRWDETPPAR